jgi:hypothetical protein
MKPSVSRDLSLAFNEPIAPEADPALRAVWQTRLAHLYPHLTFEQAMTDPAIRICILNLAQCRARALAQDAPTKKDTA